MPNPDHMIETDYVKYRGKCKELSEQAVAKDPTLRLARGWYHCPLWGSQQHWWTVKQDGSIYDPTVKQFPTAGVGAEYQEYDGIIICEYCGKETKEEDAYFVGHHAYCSYEDYGHDVGF